MTASIWKPIGKAPKDGSPVLLWCPDGSRLPGAAQDAHAAVGHWHAEGRWVLSHPRDGEPLDLAPEYWAPLPPRPRVRNIALRRPLGRVMVRR
ncbi:hypothetical protein SAMN02745194_00835 [Roseomonas rosea]|jgi:hypothetical protein|uniref:DUF551 domain-containing protein n=1 Tax=Muricoccus roseus TaxID=198092 RepID=A0A1M6D6M8_9PROT|nr:hypothetical protein [Roseomonas rosea]SHI68813.1 hypothetical protein SAMN02745194_00835 [Roseomonas rosea]